MRTGLGVLLVLWTAAAAFAAPHSRARLSRPARLISAVTIQPDGRGSLIAVSFKGPRHHRTRFLHAQEPIDRVAVRDVDNDGDLDILAAPEQGGMLLWRNRGHGRFALVTPPHGASLPAGRSPHLARVRNTGDITQFGDERNEVALLRAPALQQSLPAAPHRVRAVVSRPSSSRRHASGRAPPSLA